MANAFAASTEIAIFDYHKIANNATPSSQYIMNISEFTNQMNWLKDNGYHTITMNVLDNYMANGTRIPNKTVVLTFSDGWKTHVTLVAPILRADGFVGTFCIIYGYMMAAGANGTYANLSNVQYLQSQGDEICGHTYSHWSLTDPTKNPEGQKANWTLQLNVSTEGFRANGFNVTDFNVPYCDWNQSLVTWVAKLGYKATKMCPNGFGTFQNPRHDPRFNYTSLGTNEPFWSISDIEPNETLANITLYGKIIQCGNMNSLCGTNSTTTTTSSTSTSTSIPTITTTILQSCSSLGKENGQNVMLCRINGTNWINVQQLTDLGAIKTYLNNINTTTLTTISTTSVMTTTSTTTKSTTTILSTSTTTTTTPQCSGTLAIAITPNPAIRNTKVMANITGLVNCKGTAVSIKTYEGCVNGFTISSGIWNGTGYTDSFMAPNDIGKFGYWACAAGQSIKVTLTTT